MGFARRHGHAVHNARSRTYNSWRAMRQRCRNPNAKGYANYGGRGITICPEWESFEQFLQDMGARPLRTTLERENNDKSYAPDNCVWGTTQQQNRNTRKTRRLTAYGRSLLLLEWAVIAGTKPSKIHSRLCAGWPEREAIFGRPYKRISH